LDVDYGRNRDDPMRHSRQTGYEPFAPCFAAALWDLRMIKQVGLPDNDQLIYYDDVDLAYKGRMADWQCCFVPTAIAYHPLPCRPVETTRIRAQFLGRLAIIARYFPDNERELILTREARLADSAWQLEIVATVSRISPVGTQEQRVRLYSDWRDRYPN
jgi:GT2 family glycosyltransferase